MTRPGFMSAAAEFKTIFFDDFGLGRLARSKWNVRTTGKVVNNEQQAYVDSPQTVYIASKVPGADENVLVLHPRYRPGFTTADGQRFDFVSARIDTKGKFQFAYGSASARMKLPAGIGFWPAFWVMGDGSWPENGEIDVMESIGDPAWVSAAVHGPDYSGESGLVNRYYFDAQHPATSWHVYSLDWKPDEMTFKVDGEIIYQVIRPMVDFLGPWVFDNEKYLILNFALGGTYPFKTHGIKEPYYGLSSDTLEKIRAGEARVYVDWVRVQGLSSV
jgi:beta-glucanase (GH16 family)